MVKGTVKTNKANDTKYIYLAKNCGFNDGQEVDVSFSGIGIYNKENLEKYFKENKEMFVNIKNELEEVNKKAWKEFYEQAEIIGNYLGYGKFEWDEGFYFNKNNEYSADPFGDIDGGLLGYRFNKEDIKELKKNKKLSKEEIKKQLIDYLSIHFLQKQSEESIENQKILEKEMMKKFGFENKEDSRYTGFETTIYSNGIVQLWYDAEDYAYNRTLNISTMREIECNNKESNIEF